MAKNCVLGLGYIGFPTGLLFATHGHDVIGFDVNKTVVETLNAGKLHIKEINPAGLKVRTKNLFDSRNFLDVDVWKKAGFNVNVLGN